MSGDLIDALHDWCERRRLDGWPLTITYDERTGITTYHLAAGTYTVPKNDPMPLVSEFFRIEGELGLRRGMLP